MEGALKQKFTKPLTEITVPEFLGTFAKDIQGVLKTHPKDRTFGGSVLIFHSNAFPLLSQGASQSVH